MEDPVILGLQSQIDILLTALDEILNELPEEVETALMARLDAKEEEEGEE